MLNGLRACLFYSKVMEMIDEFLLQEGYIENQLQHQVEEVKKQRAESKIQSRDRSINNRETRKRLKQN